MPEPGSRPPGRPRSAEADGRILATALQAFIDEGYEGMSMEGVAARAGVGKTTIYRRWPSKEQLLLAALELLLEDFRIIDTGELRADLTAVTRQVHRFLTATKAGEVLPRMVVHVTSGTPLGRAYFTQIMSPRLRAARDLLDGAKRRGELRPDLDVSLALGSIVGCLMFLLIAGELPGDGADVADGLVRQLLEGMR